MSDTALNTTDVMNTDPVVIKDTVSNDKRKSDSIGQQDFILLEEDNEEGFDDYDGHFDNPTEPGTQEPSVVPAPELAEHNSLAGNDDFIAFSNSETSGESESEEDEEDEDNKDKTKTKIEEKIVTTEYPWIVNHDHSKQTEIADWLTLEIQDFVHYISPSKEEIKARNITISKLRQAVKSLWPDADLHVFGSYATDLYLPGSDIDCVVNSTNCDKQNTSSLYKLAKHLKDEHIATEIEVISKTRVPIIKFVEVESRIHIDVSFERTNGLEAAKLIRDWLDTTPGLRELVLIVKQFLHSRRLNNVHTGGLGGFSIICLVYSYLHMHPRIITNEIDPVENLGVLLIDFFELYGKNFGYDDVAISMTDGMPSYLNKYDWRDIHPMRNPFSLAIQDPGDKTNNISRGSFNIRDIKKAFAGAFDLLTNRCFELDGATLSERKGKSVLGNCIKYKGKERDFTDERNLVLNKAILENEDYHQKKRSRIIHDAEDTEGTSKESTIDTEAPPAKKRKKSKKQSKKKKKKLKDVKGSETTKFVLAKDEEDDYNPLTV
ncbi:poly(A) RNA polymerase protein 2 [Monosporozyma unispora]|nr:prolyl aminopeptidase [Kazachstania unispora]